jgi:hypothetical protein
MTWSFSSASSSPTSSYLVPMSALLKVLYASPWWDQVLYPFTKSRFIKCILMTLISSHTILLQQSQHGQCICFVLEIWACFCSTSRKFVNSVKNVDEFLHMPYIHALCSILNNL